MDIDQRIESHVRKAYSRVVGRDGDGMIAALADLDDTDWQMAVWLGVFVCGFIVKDVFPDGPTDDELRGLAQGIIDAESDWVDLGPVDQVATYLRAAADGDPTLAGLPRKDVIGLTFVCGGHLLATHRLKDQNWWEYLDEIWAALEATPAPDQRP
jgi:hypothetical protein